MKQLNLTILALSVRENSVGRACANSLAGMFDKDHNIELVDIRKLPPVWVDDRDITLLPKEYAALDTQIRNSDGVILAVPIYCYTMSSPAKAITELFASAFSHTPVGMVVAAGSLRSYLAIGDLMKSMMFEQNTICYPKTVMATSAELKDGNPNEELTGRLCDLAKDFARFTASLCTYRKEGLQSKS